MANEETQSEPTMDEILASIRRIIADEESAEAAQPASSAPAAPAPETAVPPAQDETVLVPSPPDPAPSGQGPEGPTLTISPEKEDEDVLDLTRMVTPEGEIVDLRGRELASGDAAAIVESAAAEVVSEVPADAVPKTGIPETSAPERDAPDNMGPEAKTQDVRAAAPKSDATMTGVADKARVAAPPSQPELVSEDAAAAATASLAAVVETAASDKRRDQPAAAENRTVEDVVRAALTPLLKAWLDENLAPVVEKVAREEIQKLITRVENQ